MRRLGLIAVMTVGLALTACTAPSSTRVAVLSIAPKLPGDNLLADGDFHQAGLGPWSVVADRSETVSVGPRAGDRSLRLGAGTGSTGSLVLVEQKVTEVPELTAGDRFILTWWVRTDQLRGTVQTELRVNYTNGGYVFFRGAPASGVGGKTGVAPGTSAGWTQMRVAATVEYPVAYVQAFVVDSGHSAVRGTLWISNVALVAQR